MIFWVSKMADGYSKLSCRGTLDQNYYKFVAIALAITDSHARIADMHFMLSHTRNFIVKTDNFKVFFV